MHRFVPLGLFLACAACAGAQPPSPHVATTTTKAASPVESACRLDDAAELDAVRATTKLRAGLAATLEADRAVLAAARGQRSAHAVRLFTDVEADARARLAAADRLVATTAQPTYEAEAAARALAAGCAPRPKTKGKAKPGCEKVAQITANAVWSDARSVAAYADDLERLGRDDTKQALTTARALASSLRAAKEDRARIDAPREAAERALEASAPLEACLASGGARRLPLVAAKSLDARKLTVVVFAKPPEALAVQFEEAANGTREGDLAALYRGVASGRQGSGFAIVRPGANGGRETWVLTNRHVVELAESTRIVLDDGSTLEAAPVWIDPTYDLAILAPQDPNGKLAPQGGFTLASRSAHDGEAVTATGYPSLLGSPSFQMTKGHVSNERLPFATGKLAHVQHTASIDPGSSGGPLLGEAQEVLGVNTFKLEGRENVNISVPAEAVTRALGEADRARACDASCRKEAARDTCLGLLTELQADASRRPALQRMLGRDLVAARGIASHDEVVHEDESIWTRFRRAPVATLSEAVATTLAKDVEDAGGAHPLETCAGLVVSGDTARTSIVLADGSERRLDLRREASRWVLADYTVQTSKKVK